MMYTTWGSIRGCCGHAHRSLDAAERCIRMDAQGCARQGGYSDREIREITSKSDIESYDVRYGPGKVLKLESERF